ncbi:MAG: hypothetical protein CMM01_11495 [Rhodopirellula sp.]|nr:hypothetical protein [Rhodopirellula sp.]OUX51178.1 MAG: hypothetical protein CBE43_04305 [Rhodopirellula sp. TMED283]
MSKLRNLTTASLRWTWFVLLLSLAFGYLVAGLSGNRQPEIASLADESTNGSLRVAPVSMSAVSRIQESLRPVVQEINAERLQRLASLGLDHSEPADWLTICRRLSLALVGNGLSLEEIRGLEQIEESKRERVHLENLLEDQRFHHYWAERWSRFLVGTDGGQFIVYRRRRFRIWLAEVFAANQRYDRFVRELLTAEGLWTDKPQVNFLTATFDSNDGSADPIRLAARTSRVFLGLRIDCLQCHNDFLGNVNLGHGTDLREGMQQDFHQLAAFFTSAKTNGLQGVRDGEVDYVYKYLNDDEETDVQAGVPFLPELLPEKGKPRARLATWVTHPDNMQAARAAISHVWALMFGRSMGEAVDNLPLDEPCHPMMDLLARDFVAHGFNLRRLIRVIAASEAFRAGSRAGFEITSEHEHNFAVFPLVRLRPEQVAGAIIQAARIKTTDRESSLFLQLQTMAGANDFVTQYGDVGEDEFNSDSITITQRLLMMNGELLRDLVEANPLLNASAHAGMFATDSQQIVDLLYLSSLNRHPTPVEKEHFVSRIDCSEDTEKAIEDLVWVLLNSSELAWNH